MDLAEAVGVSKRTLYKIVPSKEGLLLDVVRQNIAETQRSLAARIDDSVGVREGLNTIAREFPRLLTNMRPEVFQQIYRTYPQIEERIAEAYDSLGAPIIAFFRKNQASGRIKNTAAPETIFQMLQAFVLHFLREEKDSGVAVEKIHQSMQVLFEGLGGGGESE
jgi:AcrR family transcriptional regulator